MAKKKNMANRSAAIVPDNNSSTLSNALFVAGLLLIFGLMIYNIYHFKIFSDEAGHLHEAKVFGRNFFFDNEAAPFLFYASEYFFMFLSGSILGARFASVFYGMMTLIASYFLLPEYFSRSKKIKFVLLLGSLPYFIFFSKIAFSDIAITFFGFTGFLLLIRFMDTKKLKYIIASGIFLALGILIKFAIIPFIFGLIFILIMYTLNIDLNSTNGFKSSLKNIYNNGIANALGKMLRPEVIIFIGIPFSIVLFIYQIDQQFPFPLSFSMVTLDQSANANQISNFLVFKTGFIDSLLFHWKEILISAVVVYGFMFFILAYFSKIKIEMFRNKYNIYCLIVILISILAFISGARFLSRYTLVLVPLVMFIIFNNKEGERLFNYYPLFTGLSIITVVFMVTPTSTFFLIGNIAGEYNVPIEPSLDAAKFVNGNTTIDDFVVVGDNAPHSLYYAQTLGAYELEIEKPIEYNGKQYKSLVFQYLTPSNGVKYIIASKKDTQEMYLDYMAQKFYLEKVIKFNGEEYYYIFYIDQNLTSPNTPVIYLGDSYFSFPDSIGNMQNYYKHNIHRDLRPRFIK